MVVQAADDAAAVRVDLGVGAVVEVDVAVLGVADPHGTSSSTRPHASAVGRIESRAGEGEVRGARSSDAARHAHRAAGAGDETHAHLGQPEEGAWRRRDVAGERGQLDAGAGARALGLDGEAVGDAAPAGAPPERVMRISWAVSASGVVPNSARSPPLQNDRPAPPSVTWSTGSATASSSASTSASRIAAV